jgi:hypothetical protein
MEDILQEFSAGVADSKKEALKEMIDLTEKAFSMREGHGFLIIHCFR